MTTTQTGDTRSGTDTETALAVERAQEVVVSQRQILESWEGRLDQAHRDHDAIQGRSGDDILDNPDDEDDVAFQLLRARSRIETAEKAIAAQRPRVLRAESRYLAAEAKHLEVTELMPAQAELDEHEARTAKLVAQLVAHEGAASGRFVGEVKHTRSADGRDGYRPLKSDHLRARAAAVRFQVQALRDLAAGREPASPSDGWTGGVSTEYPACVHGPDALVPRRAYLEAVRHLGAPVTV